MADSKPTSKSDQALAGATANALPVATAAGVLRYTSQVQVDINGTLIQDLALNSTGITRKVAPATTTGVHTDVLWVEGIAEFPGQEDGSTHHVFTKGWNITAAGARLDLNEVAMRDAWEYRWQSASGTPGPAVYQSERHIAEMTFPDGIGGSGVQVIRPYTFNVYHTGPSARKVTHNWAGTSWGYSSENLTRVYYSLSDDGSGNVSATYYGASNVPGWSLTLSTSGDTISMGRATSANTNVGILGQSIVYALTSATGSMQIKLLNASGVVDIIVAGVLAISINQSTRAATFAGAVVLPALADSAAPNGAVWWSTDNANVLKCRTPAGTLKTITIS